MLPVLVMIFALLLIGWRFVSLEAPYPHVLKLPHAVDMMIMLTESQDTVRWMYDRTPEKTEALYHEFYGWLRDNNIYYKLEPNKIRFRDEQQAMLFKLRWL